MGVQTDTMDAIEWSEATLRKAQENGAKIHIERHRIGLEGELRLCVSVDNDAVGERLLLAIQEHTRGTPLFRAQVESCARGSAN